MAAGPTVKELLQAYPDQIRLVIKNYPYKYRDFSKIAAEAHSPHGTRASIGRCTIS